MGGFLFNGCGAKDYFNKEKYLGKQMCPNCNKVTRFFLEKGKYKITVFWIPTITLKQRYSILCEECKMGHWIDDDEAYKILSDRTYMSNMSAPIELFSTARKCPKCGTEITGAFCGKCGTKYVETVAKVEPTKKFCAQCGTEVEGHFCVNCGTKIIQEPINSDSNTVNEALQEKTNSIVSEQNKPQSEIIIKKEDEHQEESIYLTNKLTFGSDEIIFVDENRGIRKTIVDNCGLIHCFPGIIMEDFWMKEVETLKNLNPQVKYRTSFGFKGDKWLVLWEIQPDGRYWGDDDGFGMEDDLEIVLYTYLDMNGNFTGPFRLYSLNMKKYFTEENK